MIRRPAARLIIALIAGLCAATPVLAAGYDLKEITPAVQQALDGRKARYAQLKQLKSQGVVGEDNEGLVKVLKPDPAASQLVDVENRDRLAIYQAIVEQHNLGAAGLVAVKAAFAEVQREKADPGDMIQQLSGEWVKK